MSFVCRTDLDCADVQIDRVRALERIAGRSSSELFALLSQSCDRIPLPPSRARQVEAAKVLERMERGEALALVGFMGTGKTTFLRQIKEQWTRAGGLLLSGDMHANLRLRSGIQSNLLSWLRGERINGCEINRVIPESCKSFSEALRLILETFPESKLLIVWDEAQSPQFYARDQGHAFFDLLLDITKIDRVGLIIAMHPHYRIRVAITAIQEDVRAQYLGLLDREQSEIFIEDRLGTIPISLTESAIHEVYDATGGHPLLITKLLGRLLASNSDPVRRLIFDRKEVLGAIDKFSFYDPWGPSRIGISPLELLWNNIRAMLSHSEQTTLRDIAFNSNEAKPGSFSEFDVSELERLGLVKIATCPRIRGYLLGKMIRDYARCMEI